MKRIAGYTLFLICVAAGGALGAFARAHLFAFLPAPFPWIPTLVVNAGGSLLIGFVSAYEGRVHHHITTFSALGFCGGFTTLSHFSAQTVGLLQRGAAAEALLNIALSLIVTLAAVVVGARLAARVHPHPRGKA